MSKEIFAVCDRCGGKVGNQRPNCSSSYFMGLAFGIMRQDGIMDERLEFMGKDGFIFLCPDCISSFCDFMNEKGAKIAPRS